MLLDALPFAAVLLDASGGVTRLNPGAVALGLQSAALSLFGEDEHTKVRAVDVGSDETPLFLRNATVPEGLHVVGSLRPLLDRRGRRFGAVLVLRDRMAERSVARDGAAEGETRLRTLLMSIPNVAIQTFDRDGRVRSWNLAAERVFGWSSQDALGKTLDELTLDAESADEFVRILRRIETMGPSEPMQWRHKRRDGLGVSVYSTTLALPGSDGAVEFLTLNVDVTKLDAAEARLRRRTSELEAAALFAQRLEVAGLAWSAVVDAIAKAVREITGEACAVLLLSDDRAWFDAVARRGSSSPVPRPWRVPSPLERVLAGRTVVLSCYGGEDAAVPLAEACDIDLAEGGCSIVAAPLEIDRQVGGMLVVARAIPLRGAHDADQARFIANLARHAGLALDNARLLREAEQALRAREEFLSVASHELRTPLTALILQLELLARGPEEHTGNGKLEAAMRQTRRLARLVDELLDVSRISAGRLQLDVDRVDLVALVREVLARHEDEARRAGSSVVLAATSEVIGVWDRMRIEQVLTNLVTNAIKYGEGKPIEVGVDATDTLARIRVCDHGLGIDADDQARIFARFERAVSQRSYGGLGLGLWIVRQIVEAHGGSVQVASAAGQGSTFVVELPRLRVEGVA